MGLSFDVRSKVTKFHGHGGWHFVWVGTKQSAALRKLFGRLTAWGAIPVAVTIGTSTWNTSIFYSTRDKQYLMGIRADVRKKEGIVMGDTVRLTVHIRGV